MYKPIVKFRFIKSCWSASVPYIQPFKNSVRTPDRKKGCWNIIVICLIYLINKPFIFQQATYCTHILGMGWWFSRFSFCRDEILRREKSIYICLYSHLSICTLDRSSRNLTVDICMVSPTSQSPAHITHIIGRK